MGCGKSSVGRRLSELLCCPFMDLDAVIEARAGRSIPEIFACDGEVAFRRMELEALQSVVMVDLSIPVGKQSVPLAPSHFVGPSPKPAAAGFSLQKPTGLFAGSLKRVRKCQFHTSASQPHPEPLVLSLGGGTVMTPECAQLVKENTICIYLRTSVDTLVARLANESANRPLLNTNAIPSEVEESPLRRRIETLMALRASTYERTAHIVIDTDGISIDSVAEEILSTIVTSF